MLQVLKRLVLYSILRFFVSLSSLFSNRREATITCAILAFVGLAFYLTQDSKNKQLLEQAVTGDAETITETVNNGAWLSATDDFGRSALHIGARYSNVETVRTLLEMGANVHAVDFRQRTALHMTRYDGGANTEIVRLLLKYGADPEAQDSKGRTPLDILQGQSRYNKPAEDLLRSAIKKRDAASKALDSRLESARKAAELKAEKEKGQTQPPAPSPDALPWKKPDILLP